MESSSSAGVGNVSPIAAFMLLEDVRGKKNMQGVQSKAPR